MATISLLPAVDCVTAEPAHSANTPFVACEPTKDFQLPPIVMQYDSATKAGVDLSEAGDFKNSHKFTDPVIGALTVDYLEEGLKRMTGRQFPVVNSNDLSRGIVMILLENAPEDIRNDAEVQKALAENPEDKYSAKEAFYIRSEKDRVLIVANTMYGLSDAVVALLESVDYEILGMGVDWIYVPDYRTKPLIFNISLSDRPSFYIRNLWPHSAQHVGTGTIMKGLQDPADERVLDSFRRWTMGTRMFGSSMAPFPGHALQAYRSAILAKMRELGSRHGFLSTVNLGLNANRPPANDALKGTYWVNTDEEGSPGFGKFYYCDGRQWKENYKLGSVDPSVGFVRDIIFEDMKKRSEASFASSPDDLFVFPMDSEDGETAGEERDKNMAEKNWYPDYLAKEHRSFGRHYLLHGYKGIDQPRETWDPTSPSDTAYGLAAYLLHEYDKWIDSLPKEQQVTSTGKSKKELIRCSLSSYNYHDVPPNFNPEPRTRVAIAPFPKNRGIGKWEKLVNQEEMGKALYIMLPKEPSSNYSFYSFSYYQDGGPGGIPANWSGAPKVLVDIYRRYYEAGFRSMVYEVDFNFGKYGLGYYLATKMLWNVNLTVKDLDAIRDRWMQRSFGSAWKEMKAYYDFMLPENYPVNSPNTWAKAIRLIDAADKKLAGGGEPDAQRRIDDVKEYWYAHYLFDTGKYTKDSPEVREYLWKGQMSYMVGMQGLIGREFNRKPVAEVVGPQISAGPAHFTPAETKGWWAKILEEWKVTPVHIFADGKLANGASAKSVDLNDLVMVKEFQTDLPDSPFLYNSSYMKSPAVLMVASDKDSLVGFNLLWPFNPADPAYGPKKVSYGAEIWNPVNKTWEEWIDMTMTSKESEEILSAEGRRFQQVHVLLKAPRPGVYRFSVGRGGNLSKLSSPASDPLAGKYAGAPVGFTYGNQATGHTQSGVYIYMPKGTKTFDLDVYDTSKVKFVTFHRGLPNAGLTVSRKVDIGKIGPHIIPLLDGEDGTVALIEGNNFNFPHVYSVPALWAKSPAALLVPRAIAEADGLTPVESPAAKIQKEM